MSKTYVSVALIGEVTSIILDFNHVDRLFERKELTKIGCYPSAAAQILIT